MNEVCRHCGMAVACEGYNDYLNRDIWVAVAGGGGAPTHCPEAPPADPDVDEALRRFHDPLPGLPDLSDLDAVDAWLRSSSSA